MEKQTSVKISAKTLKKLHLLASKLSIIRGKRLNLNETIDTMVEITEKSPFLTEQDNAQIEEDRKRLLHLIQQKMKGAGPEDYASYDFDDLSVV